MQNSIIKVNPRSRPKTPVIPDKETLKAALTEFISTFIFVFAGSGSGIAVDKLTGDGDAPSAPALITSAIAHAFALSAAVGVSARLSGDPYISCCHANPAVTFGAFVSGNIHAFRGIVFWIARLLGSIVACLILMLFTGGQRVPDFRVSSGVGVESAVVLEMVMPFGLVYTVYATSVDPKAKVNFDSTSDKTLCFVPLNVHAPLAIGLIVGAMFWWVGLLMGHP